MTQDPKIKSEKKNRGEREREQNSEGETEIKRVVRGKKGDKRGRASRCLAGASKP